MNTAETLSIDDLVAWIARFDRDIRNQAGLLTQLDSSIGDGDHGVNMARGALAMRMTLESDAPADVGTALRACGAAFVAAVGGASGPLFGGFISAMGTGNGASAALDAAGFANAFAAGVEAVIARGRAEPGDKTMVDALLPSSKAASAAAADGSRLESVLNSSAKAAEAGRDATFPLVARKGRASYLGDRSANHIDPGAASAAILVRSLADSFARRADTDASTFPFLVQPSRSGAAMTTRRQFINHPDSVIAEALDGLVRTYPSHLTLDATANVISRATPAVGKVGLVSGGGSGHEPLHAGFVGRGMLDAAVCGAVFASPTSEQVLAGTRLASSGAGVVHIVKNYTGDVLNFEIAAELVSDDGIPMESVIVDDDLASDSAGDGPGRRGTAAVITVEKVCGALAESGADLATVASRGREVVSRSRSLALALDGCTHPGRHEPAFELSADEVEFGVGIHGERGTSRIPFATADELVEQLVSPLASALELQRGQSVIAIVNGLGGAYPLELSIIARHVHNLLEDRGVTIARSLVGSYVTSLDMHGASVTLTVADDALISAWDAPVRTPALTW